jgi:hypothetical protein
MSVSKSRSISKSKFIAGLQCPKLLWTHYNDAASIPEPDGAKLDIFATGHHVGDMAKLLFPSGIEVPWTNNLYLTVTTTVELMAQRKPIFEASFLHGGGYCRVDILVPAGKDEWDLYEVKSATKVKGVNIKDVAFQAYVLEGSGVKLRRLYLTHVNNQYVHQDTINASEFFHSEDVTEDARKLQVMVKPELGNMHKVLTGPVVALEIGEHCFEPYKCDLWGQCSSHLPESNVLQLTRIRRSKAFNLMDKGFMGIEKIPATELNNHQLTQQAAVQTGRPQIIPSQIDRWLKGISYPLYCLDFETINPAVPLFKGTRPYQQIPFQFSLHVVERKGVAPRHVEFLSETREDPRPALIQALKSIGDDGTILAYNMGFEKRVICDLADDFPGEAAFLLALVERFVDLMTPFSKFWYHAAGQQGSCSLKNVLPVLTKTSYEGLAIGDGGMAMREFRRVVFTDPQAGDKSEVLENLKVYCKQDTMALVDVLNALYSLV